MFEKMGKFWNKICPFFEISTSQFEAIFDFQKLRHRQIRILRPILAPVGALDFWNSQILAVFQATQNPDFGAFSDFKGV